MIGFVAQRMMDLEVESRCGAGYDEKSPERLNSRNGYRDRPWETRGGTVALKIPKLRQGSYFPAFLEPHRTAEKALAAVCRRPTSTASPALRGRPGEGPGHERDLHKSQVSRLCGEIDERVHAFLSRLIEGDWPYLWIDATYLKARQADRIVSVAAIIAVAVNTDGRREVLGLQTGASEAESFWIDFLPA